MNTQTNLFGEPSRDVALSQWHTPDWIARKLASWVTMGANVLEPSCGAGNLIAPLLRVNPKATVTGIELDPKWASYCRDRFADNSNVKIINADFKSEQWGRFDCVLMNPPFENGLHAEFLERALDFAPVVFAILPVAIEFGEERDRLLWSRKAVTAWRARLPERVKYGGASQASFETVALRVERRASPRMPGETLYIGEEVWREGE